MKKLIPALLLTLTIPMALAIPLAGQGILYNVTIDGRQEQATEFKHYHYTSFDFAAPVTVNVTPSFEVTQADVSPHSRKITHQLHGNTVSFRLENPGYYMLRLNDTVKFFVFAEKPAQKPRTYVDLTSLKGVDKSGKTNITKVLQKAINETAAKKEVLLIPAGTYTCGQLSLPSGAHIHLERGAVLSADISNIESYATTDDVKTRRFIYIKDAKGVKITGYGAINVNGAAMRQRYGDKARIRLLMAVNSENLRFEGVMFQDPGSWNTQILKCRDVVLKNIKLMNDIDISNTDGFDPDASKNVLIEDCFAYCSDDNVAIKTTAYSGYLDDVDGITVRGCVFLTKKSSLKVGTETRGQVMKNILFEDNDVIESDRGMALYVSDGATFENIRYINNRFERSYPDSKRAGIHFVVNRRNKESKLGQMKGILVKDCLFETQFPRESEIRYNGEGTGIGVVIDNLIIGGLKVKTPADAKLKITNSDVRIK